MANTLTNLLAPAYAALDRVSRERVGFLAAVQRDSTVDRIAVGQTAYVPVAPAVTNEADNTPAVAAPNTGDNTIDAVAVTISNSKHIPVRWSGEETLGLSNSGNFENIMSRRIAQGMRRLCNLMEADVYLSYKAASRAYGTAGNTPFATAGDFSDAAQARLILDDNGAPSDDLQLVLSNSAMANLRGKQSSLFKVNEAGTEEMLRSGNVSLLEGFALRQSGQISAVTKGTGSGYTSSAAGFAVGSTSIAVITGTGTILAGDVITFAGDSNKYVVTTGVAAPGTIVIAAPGLKQAIPASATALTIGANFSANLAFSQSAIVLATRMPAMPQGGDAARDVAIVQDPVSGLAFELAVYPQFRQNVVHVAVAWGYKVIKPEHVAILLG